MLREYWLQMNIRATSVSAWTIGLVLCVSATFRAEALPADMLWVWERKEDLRWMPQSGVGVAYVRSLILLRADQVQVSMRRNPMRVRPDAVLMPVVHVDIDNLQPPVLTQEQERQLVDAVLEAAASSTSGWVQLDFEARPSQRAFYHRVLQALQGLRNGGVHTPVKLSVTALASWCMEDRWLDASLVDEVVPMFFRMHRDRAFIRQYLEAGKPLPVEACRSAAGILREDPVKPGLVQRRYWFSEKSWGSLPF